VAQALASFAPGASIVEVGSGYGYLTYSLSRAGFDVKGVDISESAVKAAKARFGDLYLCEDITQFAQRLPSATDAVVMTEVLEHLERPLEVLNAIKAALRQGGKLIMTTPNRGFNGADALWRTDLPPVHLAWYSKTSIREMARRVGLSVTFQDFTTFNDARVAGIKPEGEGSIGGSILDADGAVLRRAAPSATRPTFKRWREEHWPQLARLERKRKFSRRALAHYARETDIIGAILTRT
jgi:SAM-dependent methyltransferase